MTLSALLIAPVRLFALGLFIIDKLLPLFDVLIIGSERFPRENGN